MATTSNAAGRNGACFRWQDNFEQPTKADDNSLRDSEALMHHIKRYDRVHREQPELTFRIIRMADAFAERGGRTDAPHRHEFYTVILMADGDGAHVIDYHNYPLEPRKLFFVSPGQVHQVVENRCSDGFAILFSDAFLAMNGIERCFIDDLHLFNDYGASSPLHLSDSQLAALIGYCEQMVLLSEADMRYREQAVGALLKLFLIRAADWATTDRRETLLHSNAGDLVARFKKAVEENYIAWHTGIPYAKRLGISIDHLNRTLKQLMGRTAKEYIQSRLIVESKRLLAFSPLSLKEISHTLGFSSAGNYSAFFKKQTGTTPSAFRDSQGAGNS